MSQDLPPAETVDPPEEEARLGVPIAHFLRREVRHQGRSLEDPDFARLAGAWGVPESQIRAVAGFFGEFTGPPDHRGATPPWDVPEARCLAGEAVLSSPVGGAEARDLVRACASAAGAPEAIRDRLGEALGGDRHRRKEGRGLPERCRRVAGAAARRRFVICHAEAGNPGAWGGAWLLQHRPERVLAGMSLAAMAVGAEEALIVVDRALPGVADTLRRILPRSRAEGWLPAGLQIDVLATFGGHVGGEETALINAVEGRRGEVRLRPPEPEEAGVFGLPTLVETAETFALFPDFLRRGRDDGNRLAALLPPLGRPGLVEVDGGVAFRRLLDEGGFEDAGSPAVRLGGPFGGLLFPDDWSCPIDSEALAARGVKPGNWSLEPIPAGMAFGEWAAGRLAFAAAESCGKCVPCRLGAAAAGGLLASPGEPPPRFREILETVAATSLCGFGRDWPVPLLQWLARSPSAPPGPTPTART